MHRPSWLDNVPIRLDPTTACTTLQMRTTQNDSVSCWAGLLRQQRVTVAANGTKRPCEDDPNPCIQRACLWKGIGHEHKAPGPLPLPAHHLQSNQPPGPARGPSGQQKWVPGTDNRVSPYFEGAEGSISSLGCPNSNLLEGFWAEKYGPTWVKILAGQLKIPQNGPKTSNLE